jgi:hypothetical protein
MVSALMLRDGGKKTEQTKRRKEEKQSRKERGTNWKSDRKTTASARDAGVVVWCNEEGNSGNPRGQERGEKQRENGGKLRKKKQERKEEQRGAGRGEAAAGEAKGRRNGKTENDGNTRECTLNVKTDPSVGANLKRRSGAANRRKGSVPSKKEIDERRDAQPTSGSTAAREFEPVEAGEKKTKNKRDESAERGAHSEGRGGQRERCSRKSRSERERDKKQRHTREKAEGGPR